MARLCERPGCSAPAAVAYGMESDRLLVWLEVVPDGGTAMRAGVVCRRHADAMVVPRGWTLDDRREVRPRLFRVSETPLLAPPSPKGPSQPRQRRLPADEQPQFSFDRPETPDLSDELTVGDIRPLGTPLADETKSMPWRPQFDDADDLGGVLNADSPLLSRAFRGSSRPPTPRPSP